MKKTYSAHWSFEEYVIIVNLKTHELVACAGVRYRVQFNFTEFTI